MTSSAPVEPTLAPAQPRVLSVLVILGTLSLLWSATLWWQLVLARRGSLALCGLTEGASCQSLWDASFAQAVHRVSGVPIAGWGVVWSVVALAFPLLALLRVAERGPADDLLTATRLTAAGGAVGVAVFIVAGIQAHIFCSGCFLSHVVVAGYAGVALPGWRFHPRRAARSAAMALSAAVVVYFPVLYLGMHTPRGPQPASLGSAASAPSSVAAYIATLDAAAKQTLSDSLAIYRGSAALPLPDPRYLEGSPSAPVRITEFTDVLCSHCAWLHETLATLRDRFGNDGFSVEPRQFPLDNACNPEVQIGGRGDVRCQAARALICAEPSGRAQRLASALFAEQESLTGPRVRQMAEEALGAEALSACLDSPRTAGALAQDIEIAMRYDIDGTPLVLINGRRGTSFPPFLYLVMLTGGDLAKIDLSQLPAPSERPHVH